MSLRDQERAILEIVERTKKDLDRERRRAVARGIIGVLSAAYGPEHVQKLLTDVQIEMKEEQSKKLQRLVVRSGMTAGVRFQVLERDGFRCRYCGLEASEAQLHVDHVVPVSKGGTHGLENLVASCERCNLGKGGREGVEAPPT